MLRQGAGWLFVNLLASVAFAGVVAAPVIRLLSSQHGPLFDEMHPARRGLPHKPLAPGLDKAFSLVQHLCRLPSLGDALTPCASACCLANAVLAIAFIWRWRRIGLGAASTLGALANLLVNHIRRKLKSSSGRAPPRLLPALLAAASLTRRRTRLEPPPPL